MLKSALLSLTLMTSASLRCYKIARSLHSFPCIHQKPMPLVKKFSGFFLLHQVVSSFRFRCLNRIEKDGDETSEGCPPQTNRLLSKWSRITLITEQVSACGQADDGILQLVTSRLRETTDANDRGRFTFPLSQLRFTSQLSPES